MQRGDGSEGAHILQVYDEEMKAMQSAKNSSRMLDEAYATGAAVLVKYAEQRDRLKVSRLLILDQCSSTYFCKLLVRDSNKFHVIILKLVN